jgi:hypothetical protein
MNNETKVITNNIPRDLIYGYELKFYDQLNYEEIRSDYDWLNDDEFETSEFFIYKTNVYSLHDFMAVHNRVHNPNPPDWLKPWDGYHSFGFIGGLVIRYPYDDFINEHDLEHVIVGWY